MRVKFSNNKYIHYIQQANYARLINRCTDTFRLLQGYIAERRMPNKERRTPKSKSIVYLGFVSLKFPCGL